MGTKTGSLTSSRADQVSYSITTSSHKPPHVHSSVVKRSLRNLKRQRKRQPRRPSLKLRPKERRLRRLLRKHQKKKNNLQKRRSCQLRTSSVLRHSLKSRRLRSRT